MPHGKLFLIGFVIVAAGVIIWRVFEWQWEHTQHPYLLNRRDR